MSWKSSFVVLTITILVLVLSGCAGQEEPTTPTVSGSPPGPTATPTAPPPTPFTEPVFDLAQVESLEILTEDQDAGQVSVRLRGILSNGCTRIADIVTEIEDDVISIAVLSVQDPPDANQECTEAVVPFDQTVEIADIAPGSYTVVAHGLQGTFTVAETAPPTAEATPDVSEPATASISGRVWHDLCAGSGTVGDEPPDGCIAGEDGFRADGIYDDEPGIEGLRVGIGAGACGAPATEFTISEAAGNYTFVDLPDGIYCISIDVTDEQNQDLLQSGVWTLPEGGLGQRAIVVADGLDQQEIDFGWDYDFLPPVEVDLATCENSFTLVEDVNIPDDTELAPNQSFTKRWLLRNNGTCPWSSEYSVIFVGGDQLGAPDSIPFTQDVAPGQTVEVAAGMTTPVQPGTYRGNWQVAGASGEPFGIDGVIDDAFWVRIVVSEDAATPASPSNESGTIGGVVWDDLCLNSDPGSGCIEFPEGSGIYVADGTFGRFESSLSEITISLATQSCPADGSLPAAGNVLATTLTDEDGLYRFEDLETGMYCIFMDALSDENVDLLIPGNWTWPATGVGRYTFFLDPGEQALDLDFGWDYAD